MATSTPAIKRLEALVERYRVSRGKDFRLKQVKPGDTGGLGSEKKPAAVEALARGVDWLAEQQDKLAAQDRRSLLVVFQAMDAAGKDGTIKHVFSGLNPQGCQVMSFKAPTSEEQDHDWLWRYWKALPERGRIGIFNRSYYEEVLVQRVHPEWVRGGRLPLELAGKGVFKERLHDIAAFEDYLGRNGTRVVKFFLHVSPEEQKKRFLERLDDPAKQWKFNPGDVRERARWDDYMACYEDAIRSTATPDAPWYVVPADNKWFTRLIVAGAIAEALREMKLAYPTLPAAAKAELAKSREMLVAE